MAELLLELLSEEIPARMQARAADDLQKLVLDGLAAAGITPDAAKTFVTPRRLTLVLEGVPVTAADVTEEKRGPRVGAPAAALDGFLKSTGLTLEQCEQRDTGKGVFYFAVISRPGRAAADIIRDTVEKALANFPWPKSMRWGARSERWVRPLQSILCLFDGAVIPVTFAGRSAGSSTVGHRFLAPARFDVTDYADYATRLRAAFVMLDPVERRHEILRQAEAAALAEGLSLRQDDGLLAEVTGLVEWPVVLCGTIDDAFMDVPDEVLITSMRSHQKYFSLLKADGRLANRFLVVSNMVTQDQGAAIIAGNQRVLRARLSDAKFFWDTDREVKLLDRLPQLGERLFYAQLGTVLDKVERLKLLSKHLTLHVGDIRASVALRAAMLAKADLPSEMVGEFPELQGIMGRYYALQEGESEEVANAIADHYAPQGPGDRCPSAPASVAVALADRIDSLIGFFAINERPTGSKDPFALRRAALGIIRLVLENKLRVPLRNYFTLGYAAYKVPLAVGIDETADALLDFLADRLKVHWREKGIRHDLIAAVFALGREDDLVRLLDRVEALRAFLASEDGANLLIAYRRAANIVRIEEKKDGVSYSGPVDPALFAGEQEGTLNKRLDLVQGALATALPGERFSDAMTILAQLREPLDVFFADVTVNCDDPAVRVNRLRLLARVGAAMDLIADFAKIEG